VEAHPAIPQAQQIPAYRLVWGEMGEQARLAGVATGVERGIAEPAADDHAQRAIEEEVVDVPLRHRAAG
jgi:hypothetical protein